MAMGIDACAHVGALVKNGSTIAVLGTGIRALSRSNLRLYEQLMDQGGVLVSEYPLGAEPKAHHFPRRNRIVV